MCGEIKKVLKCKSLRMSVKKRLYKGIVMPVTMYGSETWNLGAAEKKKLNVEKVRCLRATSAVTHKDGVRNGCNGELGLSRELIDQSEHGVLQSFGHAEKLKE